MKTTTLSLLIVLLFVAAPVSASETDITATIRSESAIAAQIAAIQSQIEKVRLLMSAGAISATDASLESFTVTIDDVVVVNKSATYMTPASAQAQCETIAYNTDHMWKLVTCTFAGDTIYKDVFIAG